MTWVRDSAGLFFSESLKRLSLNLKKSNLKERKSLSLIAESLVRDEKQIIWKYTWNFQVCAMNNSSKGNPPSGNLISVSFPTRLEWKGRVLQALFVCWKATRTKKNSVLSGSDQAVHTTRQPVVLTLGILSQLHFCVKLFHDRRAAPSLKRFAVYLKLRW